MDGIRFDAFARSLAGQPSRRALTGGLASGALGAILILLPQTAEAAKRKKDNDRVAAEKKRKKKITLCHSGQTIKVTKKAKKKHLRHGDTLGPCAATPNTPDTPACTPQSNPCGTRECGSVDNGCGVQVPCGTCTTPEICNNNTGQCGCTPQSNPCAGRECGTVDDGCGTPIECGTCSAPETCNTNSGQCVCIPNPNACAGRECGSVDNGCGQQVSCGPNDGACPGTDTCTAAAQCLPAACQGCDGCCTAEGTCVAGNTPEVCGNSGGRCRTCNPEVACVNGECTCSNGVSCGQGCCTTDENGRPFCDNSLRPCGSTCIPKESCCTGTDASIYQSVQEGCLPNETCAVNSSGFGECRCGTNGRCQRNQGCCRQGPNGPTCETAERACGGTCIPKEQCCSEGQATLVGAACDDGISCTSITCISATGTGQNPPAGICMYNETPGVCTEACAAGYGYGNQFPEFQREVRCGSENGQRCYCWRTTEGDNACTYEISGAPPCRRSSDCGSGEVCMRSGLVTGTNNCARLCQ